MPVLQRGVSAEPRCLLSFEVHWRVFAALSGRWGRHIGEDGKSVDGRAEDEAVRQCVAFDGCAAAAVLVTTSPRYLRQIPFEYLSHLPVDGTSSGASQKVLLRRWGACVPTACLAFGHGHLLRLVLARLLLALLDGHRLPPLLRPPRPVELAVQTLSVAPETEEGAHSAQDTEIMHGSGLCLCDGSATTTGGFLRSGDRLAVVGANETAALLMALARWGETRTETLRALRPKLLQPSERWYPSGLMRLMPNHCYHGVPVGVTGADVGAPGELGGCVPGLLNYAIVQAVASFYAPWAGPASFLARMDDVLRLALLMADCPLSSLASYAAQGGVVTPLPGVDLIGVLAKTRAAYAGFQSGRKLLQDPLRWSEGSGRPVCDPEAAEADFLRHAATAPSLRSPWPSSVPVKKQRPESSGVRVGCMYAAVWPADRAQARLVSRTFGRHCEWTSFFVSANRSTEPRRMWRLRGHLEDHMVVNLAQVFAEAREDDDFMGTAMGGAKFAGSWGRDAVAMRKRWWTGNTIQKSLLTSLYAAENLLDSADVFCLLELDSAFVAENLRAYARAEALSPEDPVFVASLNLGMKLTVGVFPHTAGGICVTRAALWRLGALLRHLPRREVLYTVERDPDNLAPVFSESRTPGLSPDDFIRLHGCGFVAGHWYDVMLGRCLVAANVSAHRGIEDSLGRYYFTAMALPCLEHLNTGHLGLFRRPALAAGHRIESIAHAVCEPYGFAPELHRYAVCEPIEYRSSAEYWISPFAIGFHGYKNLTLQRHAYRVLHKGAQCTWLTSYRPSVVLHDATGRSA